MPRTYIICVACGEKKTRWTDWPAQTHQRMWYPELSSETPVSGHDNLFTQAQQYVRTLKDCREISAFVPSSRASVAPLALRSRVARKRPRTSPTPPRPTYPPGAACEQPPVYKLCPPPSRASLDRLGAESMEIYQIHWPFGALSSRYWDGLADCVDQGLVKVRSNRPKGRRAIEGRSGV